MSYEGKIIGLDLKENSEEHCPNAAFCVRMYQRMDVSIFYFYFFKSIQLSTGGFARDPSADLVASYQKALQQQQQQLM